MKSFGSKQQIYQPADKFKETKFKARSVSRGVAIGQIVSLHGKKRQYYKIDLEDSQIEREIRRFNAAVRLAVRQLKKLRIGTDGKVHETRANIFDAHILILQDKSLLNEIQQMIRERKVNAEWSVKFISDSYISKYKTIPDEHLRERYIDLVDVAERILSALGGGKTGGVKLKKNSIIVAREVHPSTLTELIESSPKAIITETGGWTSHTFILARELNLPAVTGLKGFLRRVQTGDEVIVDGYSGQVIVNPTDETRDKYRIAAAQFESGEKLPAEKIGEPLKTLDGRAVTIRANSDLPDVYKQAKRFGAKGIGLYRSEFLFNQFKGYPSETEQIKAYRKIAEMVGDDCVHIRTFDLSYEQLSDENLNKEKNPALGLRAIRLGIRNQTQFRIQIRAILQAAHETKIDVLFPMISDVSEILTAKKIVEDEKKALLKKNIPCGDPHIGAMIEVPSAVLVIEQIIDEVDFICIGTNDLVQYLLAVDRDNEGVSEWFRTLHPAVLKAIKIVLKAAEDKNKTAIVCGEMAGSPYYVPVLIGLGAKNLSMNVSSILQIRRIVSQIAYEETLEIVRQIENARTSDECEEIIFKSIRKNWAHLFPFENQIK